MKLLTTRQVALRIGLIIALIELVIMLVIAAIPFSFGALAQAVINAALLTLFSIPAIYLWVIRPFVRGRDEALAEARRLALTDPLTQLPNRRLTSRHLTKAIASAIRYRDYQALLLLDLDGFKKVNDEHGHAAGDAVLVYVASRLQSMVRSEDVVGRLGGDEFIVLIHRLGPDGRIARESAWKIAENLIRAVKTPFDYQNSTLHIGASVGVRMLGFDDLETETAMREADRALYRAKEAGGDGLVLWQGDPEDAGESSPS